jgi:hypothetical protein
MAKPIQVIARHPDGFDQILQVIEVHDAGDALMVIVSPAMKLSAVPAQRKISYSRERRGTHRRLADG